ncbi:MAG TPA: creatininase family protein [Tepidisphaeraceae bacterium]|jgi:creatinine amidohydrolase
MSPSDNAISNPPPTPPPAGGGVGGDFILADQTHQFIRSQQWEVAVLPFGATEPHNFHMPYGTDNFQNDVIARRACGRAYDKGGKVLLLPAIPFGVNTNYLQIKGALAINLCPTTLLKIIADIVDSLERQGVAKLVLLNGHGGNELKPLIRELYHKTKMFLCVCDWFKMFPDVSGTLFADMGEHADEMETSLGLAYFPERVKMAQAGPGAQRPTRFEAINKKWISITRPWHLATADTGIGNPAQASAEKGRQLADLLSERLGDFLHQLATTPLDESFPY